MRDLALGDLIHDGVHEKGSPFVEHEREIDLLYLELFKKAQNSESE
jgi:hypothetical protein